MILTHSVCSKHNSRKTFEGLSLQLGHWVAGGSLHACATSDLHWALFKTSCSCYSSTMDLSRPRVESLLQVVVDLHVQKVFIFSLGKDTDITAVACCEAGALQPSADTEKVALRGFLT